MKLHKSLLKYFCIIIIILNACSVVFGVMYYAFSTTQLFWLLNFIGIVIFISWLLNMLLVYLNDRFIIKSNEKGKKLNLLCYGFLGFTIIAMLFLFLHTFLLSFIGTSLTITVILALVAIIGIAIFGILLAYFDIKNLENRGVWKFE